MGQSGETITIHRVGRHMNPFRRNAHKIHVLKRRLTRDGKCSAVEDEESLDDLPESAGIALIPTRALNPSGKVRGMKLRPKQSFPKSEMIVAATKDGIGTEPA